MYARLVAVLILVFTFGFVFVLLLQGYDLSTALLGAGAAGVVAAEIHRLLGGSGSAAGKVNRSIEEHRAGESSMVTSERPASGSVRGGRT
jgi:hypothetical protein